MTMAWVWTESVNDHAFYVQAPGYPMTPSMRLSMRRLTTNWWKNSKGCLASQVCVSFSHQEKQTKAYFFWWPQYETVKLTHLPGNFWFLPQFFSPTLRLPNLPSQHKQLWSKHASVFIQHFLVFICTLKPALESSLRTVLGQLPLISIYGRFHWFPR